MCTTSCLNFAAVHLRPEEIVRKDNLEIGYYFKEKNLRRHIITRKRTQDLNQQTLLIFQHQYGALPCCEKFKDSIRKAGKQISKTTFRDLVP